MSKKTFSPRMLVMLVFVFAQAQITQVEAQSSTRVECGAEIESLFTSDTQVHTYQIAVEAGTALVIYAESMAGNYQNLLVDIELSTPRGNIIAPWIQNGFSSYRNAQWDVGYTKTVRTNLLSETGNYTIRIIGYTDTSSPYRFYVSCVQPNGTVISTNRQVNNVQCGSIIENEFAWEPEVHDYYIILQTGDAIALFAESLAANYQNLIVDIGLVSPRGNIIAPWIQNGFSSYRNAQWDVDSVKTVETAPLPETGIYRISVIGYTETGSNYIFQAGCVLADGTVINPGDAPPVNLTSPVSELPSAAVSQPVFSGFGFPGIASVDFSSGIELPISTGQTQIVPLARDVALYTYNASANEVVMLNVSRVSGDISVGVTVINRDTNEIIFFGGLPSSNNLSIELTFPSAGTYAIGLFRVDTAERTGTSGAVQIALE